MNNKYFCILSMLLFVVAIVILFAVVPFCQSHKVFMFASECFFIFSGFGFLFLERWIEQTYKSTLARFLYIPAGLLLLVAIGFILLGFRK